MHSTYEVSWSPFWLTSRGGNVGIPKLVGQQGCIKAGLGAIRVHGRPGLDPCSRKHVKRIKVVELQRLVIHMKYVRYVFD